MNLAVHRQKYHVVDVLLRYHANPNVPNQAGKTALHRAAASYVDENANQLRALLEVNNPSIEKINRMIGIFDRLEVMQQLKIEINDYPLMKQ